MLPVLQFDDSSSLAAYIGKNEISQQYNPNANARLFITPDNRRVVKIYTHLGCISEKNLENLVVISSIMALEDYPQVALPSGLISLLGQTVGYEMVYVPGIDLGTALQAPQYSHAQKIAWFNQLVDVIISLPDRVFVGDLHPQNVIVRNDNTLVLIDVDGFSLADKHSLTSPAQYIEELPSKYYSESGHLEITRETDILCLFKIFFRYLFDGIDITYFPLEWKKRFPDYLKLRGVGADFAAAAASLFSNTKNTLSPNLFSCWASLPPTNEYQLFLKLTKLDKQEIKAAEYINSVILRE